jgi:hypothetical protein
MRAVLGGATGWVTLAGVALGIAYTLSPLTVWFAVGVVLLARALSRGLDPAERRLVLTVFVIAVAVRVLILGGLFLSVDHAVTPFGSLFGDEEYFKRRSLWLRSTALDVNVSPADRRYAFEEYSDNSYLYLLAFLQVLVGDAPYGVHLFSMLAYLAAAVWLFRFCRRTFGPAPAALTFAAVLFLPTLFFWSISALRESLHLLLTLAAIVSIADAIASGRLRDWLRGVVVASLAVYALKDLRVGSMLIVGGALVIGTALTFAMATRRRRVFTLPAAAVVGLALFMLPSTQARVMGALRSTALSHQGHAWTPGVHYKVLDSRFYLDRHLRIMDDMSGGEAARYVLRALPAAALAPLPWQARTRQLQLYLVEHVIWLTMVALLPLGVWAAARRHAAAAFLTASYVALMFTAIALTSGNIGTLVRHRGLILPFVICLSAVAVCHLLARAASQMQKRTLTNGAD